MRWTWYSAFMHKVGERNIIISGSAIIVGDEPLTLSIDLIPETPFIVQIAFSSIEGEPENGARLCPPPDPNPDRLALLVSLINWSSSHGTAVQMKIADVDTVGTPQPLILSVFVHTTGSGPGDLDVRLVNYTFSVGPL